MKTYQFKTNINCGGCIEKVTPVLDNLAEVASWKVDTLNPQKTLTIEGKEGIEKEVIQALKAVGYRIEQIVAA